MSQKQNETFQKQALLVDCNRKIEKIEARKQQEAKEWQEHYNKTYRVGFTIRKTVDTLVNNRKVTGGVLAIAGGGIFAASRSFALSAGLSASGYLVAILTDVSLIASGCKKRLEYIRELDEYETTQRSLEEESYPYRLVSNYLTDGDKYLLQLYRENVEGNTDGENEDEFRYLDFDTTDLSPLMLKTIKKIRTRSVELRDELRSELLKGIDSIHQQIMASTAVSVPGLEAYQKMLQKNIPPSLMESSLT